MKNVIAKLILFFVIMFVSAKVSADDFYVGGIYYEVLSLSGLTCEVTSGSEKYTGDIVIPKTVTYDGQIFTVTSIGRSAFFYCPNLMSVNIPNTVISIGDDAFNKCSGLTSVDIPSSVVSIGDGTFADCQSLTKIGIPNSVTSIGRSAFAGCRSLTKIDIPNSVTSISDGMFSACGFTSVDIPNSVTSIGENAFSGCYSLISINIPNSVTSIGLGAFTACENLASIVIPNSVTSIGEAAFSGCRSLMSVVIPNSVTSIGETAFSGCRSLMSIVIPNSISEIGYSVFDVCESLTSVVIPSSVRMIDVTAFSGCYNLKKVVIEDGNEILKVVCKYCSGSSSGRGLFYDCPVKTLYLGRNLSCENSPFENTITLADVTIGGMVTDVKSIYWDKNDNLAVLKLLSMTPPSTRDFSEKQYTDLSVYVPVGSLKSYQTTDVWKNFWNIQEGELTGISSVEVSTEQDIKVENGNIVVDNAKGRVSIYDAAGTLVKSVNANGNRVEIAVPGRGVYIVRAGGKTVKVVM